MSQFVITAVKIEGNQVQRAQVYRVVAEGDGCGLADAKEMSVDDIEHLMHTEKLRAALAGDEPGFYEEGPAVLLLGGKLTAVDAGGAPTDALLKLPRFN